MTTPHTDDEENIKKIVGLIDLVGGEVTVSVDWNQDGSDVTEFVLQEKVAEELRTILATKNQQIEELKKIAQR